MFENLNLLVGFTAFISALIVSAVIVFTKRYHGTFTLDNTDGVQKFHVAPTPRVGGVAIVLAYFVSWLFLENEARQVVGWIGVSALPVIAFGLAEDLTKNISVKVRLLATLSAGLIFVAISGLPVEFINVWWIDMFLEFSVIAIAFTALSISASTNAVNIIDGFHGLASGTVIIILFGLGAIAWAAGDMPVLTATLILAAATGGFFVVNFPFGKIFLGDAGAYFLGFSIATIAIMIPMRNLEVSPWLSPLILSYPLTELVVSVVRKTFRKGHHPSQPDELHLHMVLHRVLTHKLRTKLSRPHHFHVLTSVILWTFPAVSIYCAWISDFHSYFAIDSLIAIILAYLGLYGFVLSSERRSNA